MSWGRQPLQKRFVSTIFLACFFVALLAGRVQAQTVQVGSGSYTTALPAGATAPSSQIFNTVSGPKPTHKFWTAKNWYADNIINGSVTFGGGGGGPFNMFPQPLGMQTTASGLLTGFDAAVLNNGTFFNQPFEGDLTIGVAGLNAASVNVSAYSDWTVDFNFGPMTTRVGRGMPFVYVTTNGSNPTVTFAGQPTVFSNNGNILGVSIANNNYGLFCPSGGTWSGLGTTVLTCNLPSGHHYFSLALLPNQAALSTYAQFAFSFPINTQVSWSYNQNTSQVTTTYTVTTQAQEGTQTGFLMALYPHQYTALQGSSINTNFTYPSSRGTLEVLQGTSFTIVQTYHGILPFEPNTGNFSNATLTSFLNAVANESNHFSVSQSGGGTNTYDIGKDLARVAHLLPIAKVAGDTSALSSLQTSLQNELQNWFNGAAHNQTTNVFYYNGNWGTLIGYPAAFGSDIALNDHHFHYGYWIHSSAILGLFNPSWIQLSNWGGMVNLLGRDIAAPVRNDSLFPFLRYFDVYAGHSWASGQAPFGDGENQESSSEAMNAWTGLILFAIETGNTQLRDAAIWMYTQESNSIFDYWFNDGAVPTFPSGFSRVEIANVFDGKGDIALPKHEYRPHTAM
jgi:endoglucanase Acf2